ncbi:MAG: hypothetical protein ACI82Q_001614, partial [Nonlabens sp.]
ATINICNRLYVCSYKNKWFRIQPISTPTIVIIMLPIFEWNMPNKTA